MRVTLLLMQDVRFLGSRTTGGRTGMGATTGHCVGTRTLSGKGESAARVLYRASVFQRTCRYVYLSLLSQYAEANTVINEFHPCTEHNKHGADARGGLDAYFGLHDQLSHR